MACCRRSLGPDAVGTLPLWKVRRSEYEPVYLADSSEPIAYVRKAVVPRLVGWQGESEKRGGRALVKAVGIIGMGDPDVVQVIDAADPSCGPSEVMIRPEATSYNHVDALLRQKDFGLDFPVVPGSDVVGHVISGSSELVGRRVLVNPAIPCGKCDR